MLSNLTRLNSQGQVGVSIETTNKILRAQLDLDIDGMIEIPTAEFIKILSVDKKVNNESLNILAEIFLVIADNASQQQNHKGKNKKLYLKCLEILEYLENTDTTYLFDRHSKIERLKKLL